MGWRVLTNDTLDHGQRRGLYLNSACSFVTIPLPNRTNLSNPKIGSSLLSQRETKKATNYFGCRFSLLWVFLQLALLNWYLSAICVICNLSPTYYCWMHNFRTNSNIDNKALKCTKYRFFLSLSLNRIYRVTSSVQCTVICFESINRNLLVLFLLLWSKD